jgi:hypothetical protein
VCRTARAPRGRNELECRSRRPTIRRGPTLFGGNFLEGLDSSLYYSTGGCRGLFRYQRAILSRAGSGRTRRP